MNNKIKPCPFCGSINIGIKDSVLEEKCYAYCRNCNAQGSTSDIFDDYTDEQIIAVAFMKWNNRK